MKAPRKRAQQEADAGLKGGVRITGPRASSSADISSPEDEIPAEMLDLLRKLGTEPEPKFSSGASTHQDSESTESEKPDNIRSSAADYWNKKKANFEKLKEISLNRDKVAMFVGDIIEKEEQSGLSELSYDEKWQELERFAREHGGFGVAEYGKALFPEIGGEIANAAAAVELPTEAPEQYQGLRGPETPPEFVQRVYGPWLGHGLTRAHIRKLDPTLYSAIDNWSRRNEWPADVDLPKLKEQNDRDIARLEAGGDKAILGKFTGSEAARLGAAIARRTK